MVKLAKIFLLGTILITLVSLFSFSAQASRGGDGRRARWVRGEGSVFTGSFVLRGLENPGLEKGEVYYEEAPATGTGKVKGTLNQISFDNNKVYFWGDGYQWDDLQNDWEPGYELWGEVQENEVSPDQFWFIWCKEICNSFLSADLTSGSIEIH